MERIIISRCLLGEPVRHDGQSRPLGHPLLARWRDEGRLVPVCPEVLGGLPTPRPAAEITGGDGADVLAGRARVITAAAEDVTADFLAGARATLELAREHSCRFALLKERSPSCGCRNIYDGAFSGSLRKGQGTCAALLEQNGLRVFCEEQVEELAKLVS